MKPLAVVVALVVVIALHAAEAVPQFNAILSIGKDHRFVLIDGSGKTSSFLGLGDTFAGYTLKAYDPRREIFAPEGPTWSGQTATRSPGRKAGGNFERLAL